MRRRDAIGFLGGAAAASIFWPFAARAQQALPVVGFLRNTTFTGAEYLVNAFRDGLKETGFVEGRNVAIEFRSAEHQNDRLPSLVNELMRRPVTLFTGNTVASLAAKAITTTVPIVFTTGSDPVRDGLVASLARPGGNVTGVVFISGLLGAKRLELLRQLVPKATTIAMLVQPNNLETEAERRDVQAAAQAIGLQLVAYDVSSDRDIDQAFAALIQRGADALLVGTGPFLFATRERVVALADRHAIPAMHSQRDAAAAGGLMSYGASQPEAYRQAGVYAARILKGEKPSDMPVMQSAKFEFVINLKTAKTLGLEFHPQLLATADEVIE